MNLVADADFPAQVRVNISYFTSFGGDNEECVRTLVGLVTNVTSLLQIICQARHRIGEVVRHLGRV